jgi:hypothetical protein
VIDTGEVQFTSSIDLPDGRQMYASFTLPADHEAVAHERSFLDHTEFVQMTVATMLRNALRGDKARAAESEVPF